jgi:PKD domain
MASAVAANATGGAVVIWGKFLGHQHVTLVGASRAALGAAWSDAARIPSPAGLPNASEPSIQASPAGDFVVGWAAGARTGVGEGPPPSASVLGAYDAAPPVASVHLPAFARAGHGVHVRVHAYDTWSGVRGLPLWRFGDGSTARGMRIRHVWKRPGTYDVVLTVRDHRHHRRVVHRTITVRG